MNLYSSMDPIVIASARPMNTKLCCGEAAIASAGAQRLVLNGLVRHPCCYAIIARCYGCYIAVGR